MKTDGNGLIMGVLDKNTPFLTENVDLLVYQNNALLICIDFRNNWLGNKNPI